MGHQIWSIQTRKLEFLMGANGFPVHCGLPCGATLCTLRSGRPRSNESAETTHVLGGGVCLGGGEQDTGSRNHLKTRPNMTHASIWPASAQDLRFGGGFCVSKAPEITTFWGGTQFFGGGVAEQDTTPAGSRNHLKTRPPT